MYCNFFFQKLRGRIDNMWNKTKFPKYNLLKNGNSIYLRSYAQYDLTDNSLNTQLIQAFFPNVFVN